METLNQFVNLYQLSKTLRFGLTLRKKMKKNGFEGEIYESHVELQELIKTSEQKIIKETTDKNKGITTFTELPLDEIRKCLNDMYKYLNDWERFYNRYDQIAVLKDYYRKLERKARFDGFWREKNSKTKSQSKEPETIKKPQSQVIKLSSLNSEYEDKRRRDYITDYWNENIQKAKRKFYEVDSVLKQFEGASKQNRDDKKLNEVELRKLFLSFTNLINDTLEPLCNGSICFPDIEKLTNSKTDEQLQRFVFDDGFKKRLSEQIEKLKIYFAINGGYVPYGRVTLNKYTALQKPNKIDTEINEIIKELGLSEFVQKYESAEQIINFIKNTKDKNQKISDKRLSLIEKVQLFKYKTIPVGVQFALIEYLSRREEKDKKTLKELFHAIGQPQSPAKDYKELQNKADFNLYEYPLKIAFDYAWESLAKSEYHSDIDFPKDKCQEFLKKIFNTDISGNDNFKLYSALLFIRENLATLDYGNPRDKNTHITNVESTIKKIKNRLTKEDDKALELISRWHKNPATVKQSEYDKAKQTIGQLRGRQKNKIPQFGELTRSFKKLASEYGKAFANIRDKFNEEYEINKITHCGTIIEDRNNDQYLLLSQLSDNRENASDIFELVDEPNGALKIYQVKSLTSKTLFKFLKNKKGANVGFHINEDWKFPKGKWDDINKNKIFLDYVIKCLTDSCMAKNQKWREFNWDFSNCNSYEAIAKEVVDTKGYILKSINISKLTLTNLITEKKCLLLPIVNQDLTRQDKETRNQFTKDWIKIFESNNGYRLHPEFKVSYRYPTPNYPKPEEKRYSCFQMIAHLLCEYIPQKDDYKSRKEQVKIFNDKNVQKESVEQFNEQLKMTDDYYVFGIDRGIKQLATLCVLNKNRQIQGDFEIYTREFDNDSRQWKHTFLETRNILDLSNLRVETTIDGKKVLVDLSEVAVKVKDEHGKYIKDDEGKYKKDKNNQQNIKLKQLAYIRKLQYKMQTDPQSVLDFIKTYQTEKNIEQNIKNLITPYKEGKRYADLPTAKIKDMFTRFSELISKDENNSKKELREFYELDATDDLKNGVVASMIGIIAYLLEKYGYNVYVSLEDLTRAFKQQRDGLTNNILQSTNEDNTVDFKDQENLVLAGLGTYHYFEMQLLRKLFRIQRNSGDILHLVPTFRSVDNYEKIVRRDKKTVGDEYVNYPFGIVRFVDPKYTSKKCPLCDKINTTRKDNVLICHSCYEVSGKYKTDNKNRNYITNADDNGAYHIALKALSTLKNLEKKK
jgi:hypothetical protein